MACSGLTRSKIFILFIPPHGTANLNCQLHIHLIHNIQYHHIGAKNINADNGLLTPAGYQKTGVHPRNFHITPNGKYLLVACRDSNVIQVYRRNPDNGLLTDTRQDIRVDKPVCIQFVE